MDDLRLNVEVGGPRVDDGQPGGGDLRPKPEIVGPMPEPAAKPLQVKLPFYAKHGFKRLMGGLSGVFTVMILIPEPTVKSVGIVGDSLVSMYLVWAGLKDAKEKKDAGWDMDDNVLRALLDLIARLWKLLVKKKV